MQQNHTPIPSQANVGIAIGAGAYGAVENADLILVRSNPPGVVTIRQRSPITYGKMIKNWVIDTGYNIVAIPFAAGVRFR